MFNNFSVSTLKMCQELLDRYRRLMFFKPFHSPYAVNVGKLSLLIFWATE